jgi:hypothetical protein
MALRGDAVITVWLLVNERTAVPDCTFGEPGSLEIVLPAHSQCRIARSEPGQAQEVPKSPPLTSPGYLRPSTQTAISAFPFPFAIKIPPF